MKRCKIDFAGWEGFREVDKLMDDIGRRIESNLLSIASNMISDAMEADGEEAYLSFMGRHGSNEYKPLDVLFCIPALQDVSGNTFNCVSYKINLREALTGDLNDCIAEGAYLEGLASISLELKKLASEIDEAIKTRGVK